MCTYRECVCVCVGHERERENSTVLFETASQMHVHGCVSMCVFKLPVVLDFYPHACARGKVIDSVIVAVIIVVVDTNIA